MENDGVHNLMHQNLRRLSVIVKTATRSGKKTRKQWSRQKRIRHINLGSLMVSLMEIVAKPSQNTGRDHDDVPNL
jgi:hypothetical protein